MKLIHFARNCVFLRSNALRVIKDLLTTIYTYIKSYIITWM